MIEIQNLSKNFGSRTLWSGIDTTVNRGEMVALVGPSGSGKSTLLNCIGLLEKPSAGAVLYEGKDVTRFTRNGVRRFRRDVLGYLFQNYALIENTTVAANLEIALKPQRSRRGEFDTTVSEALERVGLAGREGDQVHQLSGGEQQRVALARLIVKRPALVLADEPTGALDHVNTTMVIDVLREMRAAGCAVVIATHSGHVRDRCDTVFALNEKSSAA
ncbi:ABC transporter ATP-binding protein [Streptomyces sp. NPDC087300]|uniref:ABC transporter ATP-binding protein n=1 Tax=Streptomyces sp. NPDC087300 TaxID=3365780 RepID=UPI0038173B0E